MPHRALDAVRAAIDAVDDLTARDLAPVLTALVDGAGAVGAAVADVADGRLEPLALAGEVPRQLEPAITRALSVGTAAREGSLLAVPLPCPQATNLVLVAEMGADRDLEVLVRATGHQLTLRLELVDARRRLDAAEARTETLALATQALGRTLELQEVFTAILSQLRLVVPYSSASVQRLEGRRLQIIGGHGFDNLDEILTLSFDLRADDNPNRLVIESRQPVILAEAPEEYPAFRENPHMPAGIRSWLGVPLEFGDRILGMLSIDSREGDFYDDGHARIAQAFAAQAAIAIENARLFGEMRRMATHDSMTGLPNRRHLDDVGAQAVERARREGRAVSLLLFDLDRFKVVNDSHGHAVGDEVLCEIARRARALVRPQDVLARFGGEEFVVLLPDTDEPTA
ncbi:diguanylate cyclase, partial [Euzebya sp.]|uniref:diguanylate cyclase n=1 Tax=Euzebya sp. TaxID=1971409 RepID=UPI003514C68A